MARNSTASASAVLTGSNVTVETGADAQALGVSGEVDRGEKGRRTVAGGTLGRTTGEVRAAAAGKVQSNRILVTEADYMTTALHFPGLLRKL